MLNRFHRHLLSSLFTVAFLFAALPQPARAITCATAVAPVKVRSEAEIKSLKFLSYNVENLFMNTFKGEWTETGVMARKGTDEPQPKSPQAIAQIRQIILDAKADILVLTEVESVEALQRLASEQLAGMYRAMLVPGNDPRGINIGFLVKVDLPWEVRIVSNKDLRWRDPKTGNDVALFSRDLPVLELRRSPKEVQPLFAVIGNHAKSKRNTPGDFESRRWRSAQYVKAAQIAESYMDRGVHLMFAGDFNADILRDPEVKPLLAELRSSLAIAPDAVPVADRVTHTFHQNGNTVRSQLDDVMVSPELSASVMSAKILRYKDAQGRVLPIPRSFQERSKQPSDHFPVLTEVSTQYIFQ